jgi:nucleotide-binding universal stress UspA family protein
MKTILILTDFSKKAENAALYALKLAEKTFADIILFNLHEKVPAVSVPEAGSWVLEDYDTFKNEILHGLRCLKENLEAHNSAAFKPGISWFADTGPDLASTVGKFMQRQKIDLVVMGAKSDNTVSHLFYGSETSEMIKYARCPVLLVPENCKYRGLETIVFANDFKEDYPDAIQFLTYLARIDNSHIILTHLGEYDNSAYQCLALIKSANEYAHVSSHLLPLNNFREQLAGFAAEMKASLVVLIHHHAITLDKILTGSRSNKMLSHATMPMLILPADV